MIRPVTDPGDLGPLASAALRYDTDEAAAIVARLFDPPSGRRTLALRDDDGVVLASVSDRDPTVGHVDLIAVHPGAQRRGRGRALLSTAEEALADLGVRVVRLAGNPPCYGWPGIDVRYTPAACLAERLGYRLERTAWNMTADLTSADLGTEADERRLAGVGVTVERSADPAALATFVTGHWHRGWAWEATRAAGCQIARRGSELLGFAAWGANRPSWFGPMGTAPAARGLGIGRVLLRRCLAEQRAAGITSAQIGWVGPLGFYADAVRARAERTFWQYRREL